MLLWIIRFIYFLLVVSLLLVGFSEDGPFNFKDAENIVFHQFLAFFGCIVVLILGLAVDFLIPRKRVANLVAIIFGIFVGFLIGMVFNNLIDFIYFKSFRSMRKGIIDSARMDKDIIAKMNKPKLKKYAESCGVDLRKAVYAYL